MAHKYKRLFSLKNICFLAFAAYSLNFSTGLGGCDQPPSAAETSETTEGDPVDVGGGNPPVVNPPNPSDNPPPPVTPPTTPPSHQSPVKNVILMVGSGMGPQQVGQLVQYRRMRRPTEDRLAIEKLMDQKILGMVTTHSYLDLVSDSASANSSMACGLKARNNTVGLDANGNPCETILEKGAKLGKATGLVSTAPVSHPAVASYLTHYLNGEESNLIADGLVENLGIDVLLAGGGKNLLPLEKSPPPSATRSLGKNSLAINVNLKLKADTILDFGPIFIPPLVPEPPLENAMRLSDQPECAGLDAAADGYSSREDQRNLIEEVKAKGYQFVCKKDQLSGISGGESSKVLGIFANGHFPRSPERKAAAALPTLAEMTTKALELLTAKQKGFVLVVQNSMTQVAAQENDPGTLLQEGMDFDAALAVALDYAEQNPETLLIVTSDHDTAGFSFAYSKQAGGELDLPSGGHYDQPYNYAPAIRLELLMEQQKSFYTMTWEILEKLYGTSTPITLDEAGNLLVGEIQAHTRYRLTHDQAKQILWRPSGQDNAQTNDFAPFYVHGNIHANLLARVVSPQTSTVWSAGTSTSTPVMVFAKGPAPYAQRVQGMIDNTEIGRIISDALLGR